jgi:hypothetical protein
VNNSYCYVFDLSTDNAQAYGAACLQHAQISLPPNLTSLSLPKSWDGPFVGNLPVGVAVLYATFGGVLAFSALYILSNLE